MTDEMPWPAIVCADIDKSEVGSAKTGGVTEPVTVASTQMNLRWELGDDPDPRVARGRLRWSSPVSSAADELKSICRLLLFRDESVFSLVWQA